MREYVLTGLAIVGIILGIAMIVSPWAGTDFYILISNITDAGTIYIPFTIAGQVYNNDSQIDYYVCQYRIYATDEAWGTLETDMPIASGDNGIDETNNVTSLWQLNNSIVTEGVKYQIRIYGVDIGGSQYPDPSVVNIPEGGDGNTWGADEVKTSTIGTGAKPK